MQTLGQRIIKEVHPEVCFWAMNNQKPLVNRKKSSEWKEERRELLDASYPKYFVQYCNEQRYGTHAAIDDLYDALAALWTASRIASGQGKRLPEQPQKDACGLAMEINY